MKTLIIEAVTVLIVAVIFKAVCWALDVIDYRISKWRGW